MFVTCTCLTRHRADAPAAAPSRSRNTSKRGLYASAAARPLPAATGTPAVAATGAETLGDNSYVGAASRPFTAHMDVYTMGPLLSDAAANVAPRHSDYATPALMPTRSHMYSTPDETLQKPSF